MVQMCGVSLLALGGSQDEWARTAGELALTTQRRAETGIEDRPGFRATVAETAASLARLDASGQTVKDSPQTLVSRPPAIAARAPE